jgi:hypothetical protein
MKNVLLNYSSNGVQNESATRFVKPVLTGFRGAGFRVKALLAFVALIILFSNAAFSQCYTNPAYCTNITAANNANYQMGIQRVQMGTTAAPAQFNNITSAGTGTQIYFDYTNLIVRALAGDTVFYTIRGGAGNQTLFRIYIDYDRNGTFGTSAPELVFTSPNLTVTNTDVSGNFILPSTLTAGAYRIRIASDGQGLIPQPCGPLTFSADFEDYTLLVPASTPDLMSGTITQPNNAIVGNNTVAFTFTNISTSTITSADVYYQLDNNTPVMQGLSSLSIAPGATYTATFSTQVALPSTGSYLLRAWTDNPNLAGNNTPANDTICRSIVTYCSGPLSGTYTINPAGSGTSNFISFGAADSALTSCGVSGPVVFNVSPGIYNQYLIIGTIPGVSATNNVVFNGNGATLQFNCDAANIAVVRFIGTKHVTIDSLTIKSTNASFGWGVHFMTNSDSNTITRCNIDLSSITSTSSNNSAGIVFSNSVSSPNTSGNNGRFNTISYCIIKGHPTSGGLYYGIVGFPQTTATNYSNNRFLYNRVENFFYSGVYWTSGNRTVFRGNTFTRPTKSTVTTTYVFYLNSSSRSDTFDANVITNLYGGSPTNANTTYLFWAINYSGTSSEPNIFSNNLAYNMTGAGPLFGFYFLTSFNNRILNNTFLFDNTSVASANVTQGLYFSGGTSTTSFLDFRNNIFSFTRTGAGAKHALFTTGSWANGCTMNKNAYFNSSTGYNLCNYLGVNYATLPAWKAAVATIDQQSVDFSPNFVNPTTANFSPQDGSFDGSGDNVISIVQNDITGAPRSLPMDIGAFEATPVQLDVAMNDIVMPVAPYAAGNRAVFCRLRNAGVGLITSATINWTINGVAQTPKSFTDSLFGGTVSANIFLDSVNIASNTLYTIVATVSAPNGLTDPNTANNQASAITASEVSGTVTINNAGSGAGVFTNFTDFATLLQVGGIGGPVTANVTSGSGPYNEQIMFTQFPGTSATNTLTVNGNGATVQFNNSNPSSIGIVNLVGTDYCTINNLIIKSLNQSYGIGVILTAGANFNKISNNTIDIGSVTGSSLSAGIAFTASLANATSTGNNGTNNLIENNLITGNSAGGPYYGISYLPTNTSNAANTFNVIRNNNIRDFTVYGFYMMYTAGSKISGNTLWRPTKASPTTFYGFYAVNGLAQDTIENNIIKQPFQMLQSTTNQFYGYYLVATNVQPSRPIVIRNNQMYDIKSNGAIYGVYQLSATNLRFYNNTFIVDHPTSTSTSVTYLYYNSGSPTTTTLRNNIFFLNRGGSGSKYVYYLATTGAGYVINNNVVHVKPAGTNNFFGFHGGNISTFTAWKAVNSSAYDQNGVSADPMFRLSVGPEFYMPGSDSVNNIGFATTDVPTDITGATRSATPDPGVYEFNVPGADAGLTRLVSPGSPLTLGFQNVDVLVKSFGTVQLTSAAVNWQVNGTAQTPASWSGALNFGDSSIQSLGQYNFATAGFYRIKAWTSMPNAVNDSFPLNDTINVTICTPLNGTYTVNPALPASDTNFVSVTAFMSTAQLCGLSGPITLNVAPGIYNGALAFTSGISGLSAINNIKIVGADSATTRIVHDGSGQRATILMDGAKHFTFRNLSIENTAMSGGGYGVLFMNAADSNSVIRCSVKTAILTVGFSTFAPIISSANNLNPNTAGNNCNYLLVDSCRLVGGYYGVNLFNTASQKANGNIIRNTVMLSPYYYGVFAYYQNKIAIDKNVIANTGAGLNTFCAAMYIYQCDNGISVTKNQMYGQLGGFAIYLFQNNGTSTSRNIIANNMIQLGVGSNQSYGIYDAGCLYNDIAYNAVNNTSADASYVSCALYFNYANPATSNNARIVNNIFTAPNGAMAMWCTNTASLTTTTITINHNVYNSPSSYPYRIVNTIFPTLASYRALMGTFIPTVDTNSIWFLPTFFSPINLRSISPQLDSAGFALGTVSEDIDGNARNTTNPDIGVYEFTKPNEDAGAVSILEPSKPTTIGQKNVKVVIKNFGINTITSVNVIYRVDTLVRTKVYTGTILPGATDTVTFDSTSGPGGTNQRYNFTGGLVTMKAYTTSPNTVTDPQNLNDTTTISFCGALSGNYTINPAGSGPNNFVSFADAVNRLSCGGVTGNVNFSVSSGTYTSQVDITTIMGANDSTRVVFRSATNNAADVILTSANSTGADNYTVRLRGVGYVSFERMTIRNTNTTFGRVVSINKFADNNSNTNNIAFRYCVLDGQNTTSTADQYAVVYGPTGDNATFLTFVGNNFRYGSYSMYLGGQNIINLFSTGLVVDSNTFFQPYWAGLYLMNRNNPKIRGNFLDGNPSYGYYSYYLQSVSGDMEVIGNNIQNIAGIYGIFISQCNYYGESGVARVNNNAVNMTGTSTQYGIYFANGANIYFMNNTVRVMSPSTTYAYYIFGNTTNVSVPQVVATTNVRFINNILYSANGYAVYYGNLPAIQGSVQVNNNLYYTGTANFAYLNGTNYAPTTMYNTFRNAMYTGSDRRSLFANIDFTSSTNLRPLVSSATAWASNGRAQQTTFVNNDLSGATRSTAVLTGTPDIGAYEITPTSTPSPLTITGSIAASNTQHMISFGDTVASLTWGFAGTLPTAIAGTYHTGALVNDPTNGNRNPGAEYMDVFWRLVPTGGTGFDFDLKLTYDPNMLGKVPFATDIKMARRFTATTGSWTHFGSTMTTVDTLNNNFTVTGLTGIGEFTGTTDIAPLPVKLARFEAIRSDEDALLNWSSASEVNSALFEIERTEDGKSFEKIGEVKAAGNSSRVVNYLFEDKAVAPVVAFGRAYYRLKMIDKDGSFEYSPVRVVDFSKEAGEEIAVYPNPFKDQLSIGFTKADNALIQVEIVDLYGKVCYKGELTQTDSQTSIQLPALNKLSTGIYVIKIGKGSEVITRKLIKE